MNRHFRGAVLAAIFCSLLSTASIEASDLSYWFTGRRTSDASAHPAAQEVVGREIRTRKVSFVVKSGDKEGDYRLNPVGHGWDFQPNSLEEYHQQVEDGTLNRDILGMVEEGNVVKIVEVELREDRAFNGKLLVPIAVVQNGQFKGWKVHVSGFLCAELSVDDHLILDERFGEFIDPQQPNSDDKGSSS